MALLVNKRNPYHGFWRHKTAPTVGGILEVMAMALSLVERIHTIAKSPIV